MEVKQYPRGNCPQEAFDNWYETNHVHLDTPVKAKVRWGLRNSMWSIPLTMLVGILIAIPIWQLSEGNIWYAIGMWGAIGIPVCLLSLLYLISSLKHWAFDVYSLESKEG